MDLLGAGDGGRRSWQFPAAAPVEAIEQIRAVLADAAGDLTAGADVTGSGMWRQPVAGFGRGTPRGPALTQSILMHSFENSGRWGRART